MSISPFYKNQTYFGDGVSHELCVPGSAVENTQRNSVGCPLDLMDHRLHSQKEQMDECRKAISRFGNSKKISVIRFILIPAHRASALCLQN